MRRSIRGIERAGTVSITSSRGIPISTAAPRFAGREEGGLHRLAVARRLDRVVDASTAHLADRLGRRLGAAGPEDAGRRAEVRRDVELALGHVDRDDGLGADGDGGHQRREADAAAADHGDPVAGPHARRLPDRADPGRDRAADERRDVERDVLRDRRRRSAPARRTPRRTSRGTSSGRRARRRGRACSSRPSGRRGSSRATPSRRAAAGREGTRRTAPHHGVHESAT